MYNGSSLGIIVGRGEGGRSDSDYFLKNGVHLWLLFAHALLFALSLLCLLPLLANKRCIYNYKSLHL